MPAFIDAAQTVRLDLKYDDWNNLSKKYWDLVLRYYNPDDKDFYKKMAQNIIGNATDDFTKIKRIFDYTQQSFHYLAMSIGESGIIPNEPKEIIKNKYGDCKDMSVLNVVLLKALGYDANLA